MELLHPFRSERFDPVHRAVTAILKLIPPFDIWVSKEQLCELVLPLLGIGYRSKEDTSTLQAAVIAFCHKSDASLRKQLGMHCVRERVTRNKKVIGRLWLCRTKAGAEPRYETPVYQHKFFPLECLYSCPRGSGLSSRFRGRHIARIGDAERQRALWTER